MALRALRGWRLALAIVGLALLALIATLYAARRIIAREVLTGWLSARGVASRTEVEAFSLSGFTGRVQVGDPRAPDFAAERVEVGYGLLGFWTGDPLGLEVRSVTLKAPVVRARLHDGTVSLGKLDPIVAEFMRRPPRPDAAKPKVRIDNGVLLLATDYGPVRLAANAAIDDGKLMSLDAGWRETRLACAAFTAQSGGGTLRLRTHGDRTELALDADLRQAQAGALTAGRGRLRLTATAPYPDLVKRRGDGAVVAQGDLTGDLAMGGQTLSGGRLSGAFTGQATGWVEDLAVRGKLAADIEGKGAVLGAARTGLLKAAVTAQDFSWSRKGGDRLTATVKLTGVADDLRAADLTLTSASGALQGPVVADAKGLVATLTGSAIGRGGWSGLGPPQPLDSADIVTVKRAARAFRLAAPGLAVRTGARGFRLDLTQPLVLTPDSGGRVTGGARGASPLLGPDGGALMLTVAGGGLPKVNADVSRLVFGAEGATATTRIRAGLAIGPIVGGKVDARGVLRLGAAGVSFTGSDCAVATATRLELGENDVEAVSGRFCPTGAPLLTMADGDWRLRGRATAGKATVPFLQASVTDGAGDIDFGMTRGVLKARVTIAGGAIHDVAPTVRFNPLRMGGTAALDGEVWTADLAIRTPAGAALTTAILRHDGARTAGGVSFDTGDLAFAPGGLQPAGLSPLAAAIGSPATGAARFTGRFDWTAQGVTSQGRLVVPGVDFVSPLGAVRGLSGDIVFTSLAPLVAAPGQTLRIAALDAIVPITDVTAGFDLDAAALRISDGEAAVGGGRIRIENLVAPFAADQPIKGVLAFEGVQLHDLVEASPFGDKVDFTAKVSGRVPFEVLAGRPHVTGGELRAIEPGRLSIQRAALGPVAAEGEVTGAPAAVTPGPEAMSDTFSDFAYQAMENLAFDTLDAKVDSLPEGRLGVLFHIVGRHDPPTRQQIRLSLADLIGRKFMNKKLPLPSGTGVNLTLDTTINLDDLLRDFSDYQALRSSRGVQP